MNNSIYKYTFLKYFRKLILLVLVTVFFGLIISSDHDPFTSLILLSVNLFISLNVACYLFFNNLKWNFYSSIFFLLKIFIGVVHYLYFIDPQYFSTGNYLYPTHEYESVYKHLELSVDYKIKNGVFAYFYKYQGITHQEIWSLISIPFIYYGKYFMNIAPLNSYFASLTALNIVFISKHFYLFSNKKLNYIFILTSLFPLTLISSLFWRDVIGMYLISLSFVLILLSRSNIFCNLLSFIISSISFYMFRIIYLLVLVFTFSLKFFKKLKKRTLLFAFLILFMIIFSFSFEYVRLADLETLKNYNIFIFLIKVPFAFIGPFPWDWD